MPYVGTLDKSKMCPTGPLPLFALSGHKRGMAGNNIAALRKQRGLSQTDLATQIGTTLNMLGKLERGDRTLDTVWMEKIANALKVDTRDLIGPAPASDHVPVRSVDAGETATLARLDLSLPMGPGASVDDYVEDEPVLFDLGYLRAFSRTPAHRLKLARGVGDSMSPTILPNDEVLIDTTQNQLLHSDRVYAASINGGAAIKRLRPIEGGRRILIISDNKTIEPYPVDAEEVRIWGRVIRFARDL